MKIEGWGALTRAASEYSVHRSVVDYFDKAAGKEQIQRTQRAGIDRSVIMKRVLKELCFAQRESAAPPSPTPALPVSIVVCRSRKLDVLAQLSPSKDGFGSRSSRNM